MWASVLKKKGKEEGRKKEGRKKEGRKEKRKVLTSIPGHNNSVLLVVSDL